MIAQVYAAHAVIIHVLHNVAQNVGRLTAQCTMGVRQILYHDMNLVNSSIPESLRNDRCHSTSSAGMTREYSCSMT